MNKSTILNISTYLLAAFFAVGAYANLFPSTETAESYLRWGYPTWFHYVTGILELVAALLLTLQKTRLAGCLLSMVIMLSAVATVVLNGDQSHAFPPLITLCISGAIAFCSIQFNKQKCRT